MRCHETGVQNALEDVQSLFLLLPRMRLPPLAKPDRRSQFGQPMFARRPKLTYETTVYNGSPEIGEVRCAEPVWQILPLTEPNIVGAFLKAGGSICRASRRGSHHAGTSSNGGVARCLQWRSGWAGAYTRPLFSST
jgi:hypothetical protein